MWWNVYHLFCLVSSSSIADDTREERKLRSKVVTEGDEECEGGETQLREALISERDQKV